MANNYSYGLFHKKVLDSTTGKVKSSIPFLPKSLAKFIIREDGKTVEDGLKAIEKSVSDLQKDVKDLSDKKSYSVFATKAEYDAEYAKGTLTDTLCVITNE